MNTSPEYLETTLQTRLPPEGTHLLEQAGRLAAEQGLDLYLVGGAVRDLLLGRPTWDLDLVVEGDAPALAQTLTHRLGGTMTQRSQFGTVKFTWENLSIDLATARSERYPRPGALPKVQPADIHQDLGRRDFTVNAMALRLNPRCWGQLLDPFGGRVDLERKVLRVLHDKSFQDDATRILRALRYEQRLGFRLEPQNEALLRRDISYLDTISGPRLWHELELIFSEEHLEQLLRRMAEVGALAAIHPSLHPSAQVELRLVKARRWSRFSPNPVFFLGLLTYSLSQQVTESVIERLKLAGQKARVLHDLVRLAEKLPLLKRPDALPSQLTKELEVFYPQAIGVVAVCAPSTLVQERLRRYLEEWRYVKPILRGQDLQRLGIASGPPLGQALMALRAARLDGKVTGREQEEAFVREWPKGYSPEASQ